ncbi:hypothetical protein AUJ62_01620 [Candidatus Pacearchaeota archaeon CG1_02_32_21]|nr:MAG: hypothetical protein AUJ62_01620 [Candidatus Pacearchaeota archaeon CG1_02_32_21]
MGLKTQPDNEQRTRGTQRRTQRFYFEDSELTGYTDEEGHYYTPREMLLILRDYVEVLQDRRFKCARELEERNNYPSGWLNRAIARTIRQSGNGLAEELVKEFSDRDFGETWLNKSGKVNK